MPELKIAKPGEFTKNSVAIAMEVTAKLGQKIKVGRYVATITIDTTGLVFVVRSPEGKAYEVRPGTDESEEFCGCPDFDYRHAGHGTRCKHMKALESIGLLQPQNHGKLRDLGGPDLDCLGMKPVARLAMA